MDKHYIIGLTGQSGAGKTRISRIFAENGFYVIDCDIVSRKVTAEGSECCKKLAEHFPDCFSEGFLLDRRKLASQVFSDKEKLKLLNETIFPFISAEIDNEIKSCGSGIILLDAPTLFEAGMDSLCDKIISVTADEKVRFERIRKRDNIDDELIRRRFSSQLSQSFFRERSDWVIENNGGEAQLEIETERIIRAIKEIADVPQ